HGPGYVSGKQTKSAPSAAARSIHCTASAASRSASPGGCEIGCTAVIRNVIGVSPKHYAASGNRFCGIMLHKKLKIVNRFRGDERVLPAPTGSRPSPNRKDLPTL